MVIKHVFTHNNFIFNGLVHEFVSLMTSELISLGFTCLLVQRHLGVLKSVDVLLQTTGLVSE